MLDAFIKILTISVWPAVVLWLAWYLRDEIKRVAGRTVKAGLSGVEFAPPPPEQVASSPSDRVLATVAASQTSQVGLSRRSLHASEGFCPTNRSKGPLRKCVPTWERSGQIRQTKLKGSSI